jgi:hypothetical protein
MTVGVDHWQGIELLLTHSQCVRLELSTDWRDVAAAARALLGMRLRSD